MNDKTDYGLISADSHVFEPADLFEKSLPAPTFGIALRKWASRMAVVPGSWRMSCRCRSPHRRSRDPVTRRPPPDPDRPVTFDELMPGLYDPAERIKAQDADSVDAEVLYASPHLWDAIKQVDDAELRLACARVYNDWISEFCSYDPSRLIGVGKLPTSRDRGRPKELVRLSRNPTYAARSLTPGRTAHGDRPTRRWTRSGTWPTRREYP